MAGEAIAGQDAAVLAATACVIAAVPDAAAVHGLCNCAPRVIHVLSGMMPCCCSCYNQLLHCLAAVATPARCTGSQAGQQVLSFF